MRLITSISLLIIAMLLAVVLLPIGFVLAVVLAIFKGHGEDYLYKVAMSIDQLGNVVCIRLFNLALISKTSVFKFGSEDETISSVLGRNKKNKTLTWCGKLVCWLLNSIQRNHVEDAVGN